MGEKYRSILKSIFDELTTLFDRLNEWEISSHLLEQDVIDNNIKRVVTVITSYWNLPEEIILNDFRTEIERKAKIDIDTPDILTYQIRFALEEGSWIVLLREFFPKMMKDHFSRLLVIEDSIWNSGKSQIEDYAYYLIELNQVKEIRISSLAEYWLEEHPYATGLDVAQRIIAAMFQTTFDRGITIFERAKTILQSKLKDLSKIVQIKVDTPWYRNAQKIYEGLLNNTQHKYNDLDTVSFMITLSLLQLNLTKSKQTIHNIDDDIKPTQLLDDLSWNEFDLNDPESITNFTQRLLVALYNRPEEDPVLAAQNLLLLIMEGIGVKDNVKRALLDELEKNLENQTANIIDEIDRQKKIVEVLEINLPLIIMTMKSDNSILKKEKMNLKSDIQELEIWDAMEANFHRARRIKDPNYSKPIIKKMIQSLYELLISKSFSPSEASRIIIDKFTEKFNEFELKINEVKNNLALFIEENDPKDGSLAVLDIALIDYLSESIQNWLLPT